MSNVFWPHVVVTGGAGFCGLAVVYNLADMGLARWGWNATTTLGGLLTVFL